MSVSPPDNALWEAFCQYDRQAFAELFKRYYPVLYKYGIKVTPNKQLLEDCIQELFLELWNQKKEAQVLSVKAYLLRAIKYKLLRGLKTSNVNLPAEHEDLNFEISHDNFLIANEENTERTNQILSALHQLPPRQREIVYLKYFHELTYEEVSHIMDINYQASRNLLYQAVKSLRKILAGLSFMVYSLSF